MRRGSPLTIGGEPLFKKGFSMQSTAALRQAMAILLAADTATLAQAANENIIALVKAAFNPSEDTIAADLTLADFDGSTPLDCALGTQPSGLDPNTNDVIISLEPAAGTFRFETTGVTNLPQTIYGFALLNAAGTTLWACEAFDDPITLTAVNQVIELEEVNLRQLANTLI